jgi:hypothetical protein
VVEAEAEEMKRRVRGAGKKKQPGNRHLVIWMAHV